jgi:hypothetical protein
VEADNFAASLVKGGQVSVIGADDGAVFLPALVRQPVKLGMAQPGQIEAWILCHKEG